MSTTKKVLLIENDPALLKLLQSRFEDEKIEFSTAILPDEGLRKIEETLPDLVILDMALPRKSGIEVLEQIRENPKTKDIAVLALTIVSEEGVIQEARRLGVVDYIIKGTISLEELENKVKTILWPKKS